MRITHCAFWLLLPGKRAIVANIDDVAEHYILLKKAGFSESDIDTYFRIVVNKSGASWTFVC